MVSHSCPVKVHDNAHLANRIEDVLFVGDVSGIEGNVVVSLDDVKDRDDVAASEELFDDVSTDETAPANDQVHVFGLGRHFAGV